MSCSPSARSKSMTLEATASLRVGTLIGVRDLLKITRHDEAAFLEPNGLRAELAHGVEVVRSNNERATAGMVLGEMGEAFTSKRLIANGENLIEQQDFVIDADGHRKGQTSLHSG